MKETQIQTIVEETTIQAAVSESGRKKQGKTLLADPFLVVLNGKEKGRKYLLIGPKILIGRASRNHIQIKDPAMSADHATIEKVTEGLIIEDLGSRNGTKVNYEKVTRKQLVDCDRLRLGNTEFLVRIPSDVLQR